MKLGVTGQVLGEKYSLSDTLKVIEGMGIEFMEIWPVNIGNNDVSYSDYTKEQIKSAKETIDKSNVSVYCVSYPGAFHKEIASNIDKYAAELCDAVEVAHDLGAKYVNHYCYYLSLDSLDKNNLINAMSDALELAKKYGIILVLENEAHDQTKTPENMLKVMEVFNDNNFKTNYDSTNYYEANTEGYPHGYNVLKDYIAYIHLKNGSNAKEGIKYSNIRSGAVNIPGVICKSMEDAYDGYYTIEPHCSIDNIEKWLESDINYIKNIVK